MAAGQASIAEVPTTSHAVLLDVMEAMFPIQRTKVKRPYLKIHSVRRPAQVLGKGPRTKGNTAFHPHRGPQAHLAFLTGALLHLAHPVLRPRFLGLFMC